MSDYAYKELQEIAIERGDALIKARSGLLKIASQSTELEIKQIAMTALDESTPPSVAREMDDA